MDGLTEGFCWYFVFLFSVTVHEAAHAWAAKLGGDLTAYYGGQVSIDPMPHIRREPLGMVALPIFSVLVSGWPLGFASTPYDPAWAHRYPRRAAWMALAGPAANLALVVFAAILIHVGIWLGYWHSPESAWLASVTVGTQPGVWSVAAMLVSMLFSLNLILAVLNMIPLPPLDGSGALALLLSEEAADRYQSFLFSQPMLGWFGIVIAWKAFRPIFGPIFTLALNLLYPGLGYA